MARRGNTNKESTSGSMLDRRVIYDITPFSMLDYPDVTSCILWFAGCNMRCDYCYNPDIVRGRGRMSIAEALTFVQSRSKLLDGVVLSGGECTLHREIIPLASEIKELGMLVKVDTNGSHPKRIQQMITLGVVDYVSLDFKALPGRYKAITRSGFYGRFEETINVLLKSNTTFEVRTTIHSALISDAELNMMADHLTALGYTGKYFVQNFVGDTGTLKPIEQEHIRVSEARFPRIGIDMVVRS